MAHAFKRPRSLARFGQVPIIGENPLGTPAEQARRAGIPLERFSPAVPFSLNDERRVPVGFLMDRFRAWVRGLSAAERLCVRKHFEEEGGFDDTERGREFMDVLRKET